MSVLIAVLRIPLRGEDAPRGQNVRRDGAQSVDDALVRGAAPTEDVAAGSAAGHEDRVAQDREVAAGVLAEDSRPVVMRSGQTKWDPVRSHTTTRQGVY